MPTLELMFQNKRNLHNEKPGHSNYRVVAPQLLQQDKAHVQQWRLGQPKTNKIFKKPHGFHFSISSLLNKTINYLACLISLNDHNLAL